jgi:hypothetical protein
MAALAAQVQVGGLRELLDQLVQMLAIPALRSHRAVLAVLAVLLFLVIQTLLGLPPAPGTVQYLDGAVN